MVPELRRTRPDSRALSYQCRMHLSLTAYFACVAEILWVSANLSGHTCATEAVCRKRLQDVNRDSCGKTHTQKFRKKLYVSESRLSRWLHRCLYLLIVALAVNNPDYKIPDA